MTQVNFYSKEQIDEREIGEPTDSASSTGSLWARIKNAVARIGSLETADTDNVKKTGTSTVTGTLEVPTIPPTPTSAVNSVYVNNAGDDANNIVHRTGQKMSGAIIGSTNIGTFVTSRADVSVEKFHRILKMPIGIWAGRIYGVSRRHYMDMFFGTATTALQFGKLTVDNAIVRVYFAMDDDYMYILVSDTGTQGGDRMVFSGNMFAPSALPSSINDTIANYVVIDNEGILESDLLNVFTSATEITP